MKRNQKLLGFSAILMSIVFLCGGCSSKKNNGADAQLAAIAADKSLMVVSGDIKRLFDQLDIKSDDGHVVLPDYMVNALNLLGGEQGRKVVAEVQSFEGVDFTDITMSLNDVDGQMLGTLAFAVTDDDDLEDWLTKAAGHVEESKTDGCEVLSTGDFAVVLSDDMGFVLFNERKTLQGADAVAALNELKARSAANPLSDWKKTYLAQESVVKILVDGQLSKAVTVDEAPGMTAHPFMKTMGVNDNDPYYVGMTMNLDGPTVSATIEALGPKGDVMKSPYMGRFDTSLMEYAYPTDIVGVSVAMNRLGYEMIGQSAKQAFEGEQASDFSELMDMRYYRQLVDELVNIPAEYLTEGGLFGSFGIAEGQTLGTFNNTSPRSYHLVVAARVQPDKALAAFDGVCAQIARMAGTPGCKGSQGGMSTYVVPLSTADRFDYKKGYWISETMDITVALDNDVLIVTNSEIRKNASTPFSKQLFEGSCLAIQSVVNDKTPVFKDMGMKEGLEIEMAVKDGKTEARATVTDTQKNFLQAVLGVFAGR